MLDSEVKIVPLTDWRDEMKRKDSGILSSLLLFFGSLWCIVAGNWPFQILAVATCGWAALELTSLLWKDRDSSLILLGGLGLIVVSFRDLCWLRNQSIALCFFPILLAAAYDIFAMLVGKSLGKRIVAPEISPTKTHEGTWGGVIALIIIGNLYDWLFLPDQFLPHLIPILLLAALLAPITDFALSGLKRMIGVKDSCDRLSFGSHRLHLGRHGGILDRAATHLILIIAVTVQYSGRFFLLP